MNSPTPLSERHESLDLLRGIAVCGLVPINCIEFSLGWILIIYPDGIEKPAELGLWLAVMTFGTGKFVTLFSMLFGAGLILFTDRAVASGRTAASVYLPRMGWLWLFGILHAYLIWHGDILVAYAVTGFVLFWCRKWSTTLCWIVGAALWAMVVFGYVAAALVLHIPGVLDRFDPASFREILDAEEKKEAAALLGNWWEQMRVRALYAFATHIVGIPLYMFWYCAPLMFFGMALMKSGFFSGGWARAKTKRATVGALIGGIILSGTGFSLITFGGWSPLFFWGYAFAYLGVPILAFGYAGAAVLWASGAGGNMLRHSLCSVGRMAFSNYIAQSIIWGLIYYGHGLGLRGKFGFAETMAIVPAVWIIQLIVSRLWMQRFAHGPLEWLWRRLTYGGGVPFLGKRVPPSIPLSE